MSPAYLFEPAGSGWWQSIPLIILKGEFDNLMLINIAFVIVIGLNGIPLHFIRKKLQEYKDDDVVPDIFIFRLMLSVTVSQISWWGGIIIGFLRVFP